MLRDTSSPTIDLPYLVLACAYPSDWRCPASTLLVFANGYRCFDRRKRLPCYFEQVIFLIIGPSISPLGPCTLFTVIPGFLSGSYHPRHPGFADGTQSFIADSYKTPKRTVGVPHTLSFRRLMMLSNERAA